jgi:hypothetical protein
MNTQIIKPCNRLCYVFLYIYLRYDLCLHLNCFAYKFPNFALPFWTWTIHCNENIWEKYITFKRCWMLPFFKLTHLSSERINNLIRVLTLLRNVLNDSLRRHNKHGIWPEPNVGVWQITICFVHQCTLWSCRRFTTLDRLCTEMSIVPWL